MRRGFSFPVSQLSVVSSFRCVARILRTAMPSDVRKVYDVYDLPATLMFILGCAHYGRSPRKVSDLCNVGAEPPPHIERHSRNGSCL